MSKYSKVLEFFVENGIVLNKEQISEIRDIFKKEPINEVTILKPVREYSNIGIAVNSSSKETNIAKDPYIKVFTGGSNPNNCEKLARINLRNMSYVIHYKDSTHPKKWELNNKEKDQLNKIMKTPGNIKGTIWDDVIYYMALEFNMTPEYYYKMFPEGCPDFRKLS